MNAIWPKNIKNEDQFNEYFRALQKYDSEHLHNVITELADFEKDFWPSIREINMISKAMHEREFREKQKENIPAPASNKMIDKSRANAVLFCKQMIALDNKPETIKCDKIKDESTISIYEAMVKWVQHLANSTTDLSKPRIL